MCVILTPLIFEMSDSDEQVTEELKILNQRLTDSTYLEDRIEALENLYIHVRNDCNLVGIHCLSSVIRSLQHFVHKYHFEILTKIFNSLNGKEFVEIFMKNQEYLNIIINAKNRRGTDLLILLCHFDHKRISETFDNQQNRKYFTKLSENHLNLLSFLLDDNILKKNLVQEGLLEKIFVFLEEKRAVKKCFILVEIILRESHFCQDYFDNNCLNRFMGFKNLSIFHFFNVLVQFLDISNKNFPVFQKKLTKREFIERGRELKRYDFLFKYFYGRYKEDIKNEVKNSEDSIEPSCSLGHLMVGIDLYAEFLQTSYRRSLIDLFFEMKPAISQNIDLNEESALFYLCNIINLKYHDEKKDLSNIHAQNYDENDRINSEDKLIEKYIQDCHIILKDLKSHAKTYQMAVLTVLIISEEHIAEKDQIQFTEMIYSDDQVDMVLKGATVLLHQPDDIREEYLLKCVRQYKKFLINEKKENLHQHVFDFLEKQCITVISSLEDKINSRHPHVIDIQEEMETKHQEIDNEEISTDISPKMSTRDVIQSFVTDFSKRFLKKDEDKDDTFDL